VRVRYIRVRVLASPFGIVWEGRMVFVHIFNMLRCFAWILLNPNWILKDKVFQQNADKKQWSYGCFSREAVVAVNFRVLIRVIQMVSACCMSVRDSLLQIIKWACASFAVSIFTISIAEASSLANEPIIPVPYPPESDPRKIELGRRLFHDPRLSADNTISCSFCHPLDRSGVDGRQTSIGINGVVGELNAPTVINSGLQASQFWDGRVETLEEQVEGPVTNPKEMGSTWSEVIRKISADHWYRMTFDAVYEEGVTADAIKDAIARYEESLVTPDGPFDRYLKGERDAINQVEKEGYQLFKNYGCASCHQGRAVGGNMYEKLGIVKPYYTEGTSFSRSDLGRFNVTGSDEDRFEFKVPSLRNVALTAPYFHDGSVASLDLAVRLMGEYQLGRRIPEVEIEKIVAFLHTLSGQLSEISR